jgi:hypothetical protein
VIEHMHLLGIHEDAGLDITDEGIVGEGIPQAGDDVVEFARAHVALGMLHVIVEAEVQRGIGIRRGDDIPAGASARDVIERGEAARDVKGRVKGGGAGGDEADPFSVTAARKESSVNGSNEVTVWLRFSASTGISARRDDRP